MPIKMSYYDWSKKKNHRFYRHPISERNSPIIHSPSHRWKRTSLSVQFSVCGLNSAQLVENGQMFPARPRERNRGACAALPAPAADSRSPWLATREYMKGRKEMTSGWGYFFPGAWSVRSGLENRGDWSHWRRVCNERHHVSRTRSCAYFKVFMLVFIFFISL